MKRKTAERPVFQMVLKQDRRHKLDRIAEYRGQNKSQLVKGWIDAAYAKLPSEAK